VSEAAVVLNDDEDFSPPRRNYLKWVYYSGLFILSFFIFFLFTFPYGVVKESIIGEVSQATGLNIRVKEVGPSFPIGVDAEELKIATQDGMAQVEFKTVDLTVSILPLFIGRVKLNAELVTKNKGLIEASASFGILQLINRDMVPSSIYLDAKDFELGPIVTLALREKSKTANELVKDLMNQITFAGNLTGKTELKLAASEPIQSTGVVDLQLQKASLSINNPNLALARQVFEKGLIKGNLANGKLSIDPNSALNSQELKVAFKGNSVLRTPLENSLLDFVIALKLEGTLKENFGFIMSVIGGNEQGVNYTINGTISRPNFQGSAN
jgi:type II secretion system protein N